jgi:hypothetical protein
MSSCRIDSQTAAGKPSKSFKPLCLTGPYGYYPSTARSFTLYPSQSGFMISGLRTSKCQPSSDDLKPFLQTRKNKVLCALQWLVSNHCYYRNLMVNYPLLASWPEDFIPSQISINVSHLDVPDHSNGKAM